jgi:hypothetical protein
MSQTPNLKKTNKTQKKPYKTQKKPNKTQKNPPGWFFFLKTRVFSNPAWIGTIKCVAKNNHKEEETR